MLIDALIHLFHVSAFSLSINSSESMFCALWMPSNTFVTSYHTIHLLIQCFIDYLFMIKIFGKYISLKTKIYLSGFLSDVTVLCIVKGREKFMFYCSSNWLHLFAFLHIALLWKSCVIVLEYLLLVLCLWQRNPSRLCKCMLLIYQSVS